MSLKVLVSWVIHNILKLIIGGQILFFELQVVLLNNIISHYLNNLIYKYF